MTAPVPSPGSPEAVAQGCTKCWVAEEVTREGPLVTRRPVWVITPGCPVHDVRLHDKGGDDEAPHAG